MILQGVLYHWQFHIQNKNTEIENLSTKTFIKTHKNKSIYTLLILKDKRISCTSDENKIDIYNKTTFELNISIKIKHLKTTDI